MIHASGCYNFQKCRIPLDSNIRVEFWRDNLRDYHDSKIVNFLEYGWPVNYCAGDDPLSSSSNHPSAHRYPLAIDEYIQTELQHRALAGPYDRIPFPGFIVSPLHTVPKKKSDLLCRRIVLDLSHPARHAVNDGIPKESYLNEDLHLAYPSVDRLIELIVEYNEVGEAWMLKRDLSRAYRQLKVDPFDYRLLGFQWRDKWYFDLALPFGLRSAAQACQRTTNALSYILKGKGIDIINYVDDLACVASSRDDAVLKGAMMDSIISESGLSLAHKKSVTATQEMTFLGIKFNSAKLTMEVTEERLLEIQEELGLWSNKRRATKKEIVSLAGKLLFIAKCCKHGRCLLSRILHVLRTLKRPSHVAHLNAEFRKDVQWWNEFLPHFHTVSIINCASWSLPDATIATDACLRGGGGTFGKRYFMVMFPGSLVDTVTGITQLEAMAVIIALKLWGRQLQGTKMTILCDNEATVAVVNTGRSKEAFLQQCAREIAFIACTNQFEIRAIHIRGRDNRLPDLLSRACMDKCYFDKFLQETDGTWQEDIVDDCLFQFSCPW